MSRACRSLAPILQRQAGPSRFISPYITAVNAAEDRAGSAALPRVLPPGGKARPAALHVRGVGSAALTAREVQAPAEAEESSLSQDRGLFALDQAGWWLFVPTFPSLNLSSILLLCLLSSPRMNANSIQTEDERGKWLSSGGLTFVRRELATTT